jgi:hypothetical protein
MISLIRTLSYKINICCINKCCIYVTSWNFTFLFQIAANSLNFFESTTEGANLTNSQYIEKKIIFHKELKKGTFDIGPFVERVLVVSNMSELQENLTIYVHCMQ